MVTRLAACLLFLWVLMPQSASAALVWSAATGGNGHQYEFISALGITWDAARAQAEAKSIPGFQAHLATITSPSEHQFLVAAGLCNVSLYDNAWLGGFQQPNAATPADGWTWVTGEPWSFTQWKTAAEPNDAGLTLGIEDGEENYLALRGTGFWNDDAQQTKPEHNSGYIVEWTPVPIPEPATAAILLAPLLLARRRTPRH